jgi:hypothetical protein
MKSARLQGFSQAILPTAVLAIWGVFGSAALAQNPVPLVNQPLVPDAAAPGGPPFTLTVNGAGFVSGSVVQWNGRALPTQFISGPQLRATVPSEDIATASTASVTVVNPGPGGRSNVAFFTVATPISVVGFSTSELPTGGVVITADFNGDDRPDLAVTNSGDGTVAILLGNSDGTFQPRADYAAGPEPWSIVAGDFNGDGKQDLAVAGVNNGQVSILLGNGDGSFRAPVTYQAGGVVYPVQAAADFNGDGKLDLVVSNTYPNSFFILMGNGDGTFQSPVAVGEEGCSPPTLGVGDFNNDGKPDLALLCSSPSLEGPALVVYLGNGDGSFQSPQETPVSWGVEGMAFADWNGDGRLDAVVLDTVEHCSVNFYGCTQLSFLPGNGDGTFAASQTQSEFPGGYGGGPFPLVAGDFNADGDLDLVAGGVTSSGFIQQSSLLLGNGDGSFQAAMPVPAYGASLTTGDFNGDGRLDLASSDNTLLLQLPPGSPVVALSTTSVTFSTQLVSTTSDPQPVKLTNTGNAPVIIISLAASGDFAQTNTCGGSVGVGASCSISVRFTPTAAGTRTGTVTVKDKASGSPQMVQLTGIGTAVSLSATRLTFPDQNVGTITNQSVKVTNHGNSPLSITSAATTGDFTAHRLCGSSINGGGFCLINVVFKPSQTGLRTGVLTITHSDPASPQILALMGTGTAPTVGLSAASLSFAGQIVGTSSTAQTVTLTNSGDGSLTISGVTTSGDFTSTPGHCAGSIAAGKICEITVAFKPQAGGSRTGSLSIADDAANSPQTVALSGTGQDFAVSASTTSATVTAGQAASYTLSLASQGGFSGAVALTCTGAPSAATCSLTPSSVTLAATGTTQVTVGVATTARSVAPPARHGHPPGPVSPGLLRLFALLIALGMLACRRPCLAPARRGLLWAPLAAALLFVTLWTACGGSAGTSGPPPLSGTPAGTYTLSVAASGSGLTNNTSLTLVVN